ncbi:glutamate--tRNA ligase [Microaceticoccus formicicus]|uniref:glutamate--tRNA ligase n=1 Tax=Microaceticoccus formicicus TaxID=3118105 RepID=UPI003CD04EA7|nr:glutamate--tRNA ligase [Peptoniphilaceae bacterium AMB_02]
MSDIRVRFAPSPTGYLHIGGLRTALYNYLFARQNGGKFILRIEDTDRTRFVEGALENLINSLKWAGVEYDEGVFLDESGKVVEKGDCGPYIQSVRQSQGIYDEYIEKLLESGHAYYCFCTKERLDNLREQQKSDGIIPRYDGLCRSVSLEEAKQRIANGEEYVIRLKLPVNTDIVVEDLVKGKIVINTNDMDDQVLIKSDGFPTYHFAVVVDDHLMGITHIVRGDEWLPSTPKHVYLYEAFGWDTPVFVHLPTVLNKFRKKLSKRNDDVSVDDFINQGYTAQGLVNYLALVGWSPEGNDEILSMDELIKQFSFNRVSKTGGIFDRDKLNWVNAHYIREMSDEDLASKIKPYLQEAKMIDDAYPQEKLNLLAATFKESLDRLMDITEQAAFLFEDKVEITEEDAIEYSSKDHVSDLASAFIEELSGIEEVDLEFAKTVMKKIQKQTGIKGKDLFMPVRALLTGKVHGPELVNVIELLGKDKLIKRLEGLK